MGVIFEIQVQYQACDGLCGTTIIPVALFIIFLDFFRMTEKMVGMRRNRSLTTI